MGIFNFDSGRNEFESGAEQTNYSIGTFLPLLKFGFAPLGIQLFPNAGYTYNDGEIPCDTTDENNDCQDLEPNLDERFVLIAHESHSGYLGMFGLRQLSTKWSALGSFGGSLGTDDYSGYWLAGGVAYQLTKRQSIKCVAHHVDNSYGQEQKVGLAYSYQFN